MFPGSNFEPKLFEKLKNKLKKNLLFFSLEFARIGRNTNFFVIWGSQGQNFSMRLLGGIYLSDVCDPLGSFFCRSDGL